MDERYVEAVLDLVEQVPAGRVTTYGALAHVVRCGGGRGGPRQVGQVLARHSDDVPWWRVVRADGRPASCHQGTASDRLQAEGTPMSTPARVDLDRAMWLPPTARHVTWGTAGR